MYYSYLCLQLAALVAGGGGGGDVAGPVLVGEPVLQERLGRGRLELWHHVARPADGEVVEVVLVYDASRGGSRGRAGVNQVECDGGEADGRGRG